MAHLLLKFLKVMESYGANSSSLFLPIKYVQGISMNELSFGDKLDTRVGNIPYFPSYGTNNAEIFNFLVKIQREKALRSCYILP